MSASGAKAAAPDGEVQFTAQDSDGNKLNIGSVKVHNGFFASKFLIPSSRQNGQWEKINFAYKSSGGESSLNFCAEVKNSIGNASRISWFSGARP